MIIIVIIIIINIYSVLIGSTLNVSFQSLPVIISIALSL